MPCLFGSFLTCPQEAEAAVLANDGGEVPRHAQAHGIPVVLKLDSDDSELTIEDHVTRRSRQASYSWPAAQRNVTALTRPLHRALWIRQAKQPPWDLNCNSLPALDPVCRVRTEVATGIKDLWADL